MEEKIFQKQLRKGELEKLVVDDAGDSTKRNFNSTDLKDIFILEKTCCETYDVLASNNGVVSKSASSRVLIEQLHSQIVGGYRCTRPRNNALVGGGIGGEAGSEDPHLAASVLSPNSVSFIMSLPFPGHILSASCFSCLYRSAADAPASVCNCAMLESQRVIESLLLQVAQELGQGRGRCS